MGKVAGTTGLRVEATLFDTVYEKGLSVTDKEMKLLMIEKHDTCSSWNYMIRSRKKGSNF
jgi:hypothetical protein